MGIKKIADGIEQAKLGYMESVCTLAEKAKADLKAANGDGSRSESWMKGSAVASSAMYELAKDKGVDDESGVPGYIAVSSACDRCFGEDSQFLSSFGVARITGDGSDYSFSCDSLRAAMRMKALANEFTNSLRAVAGFE